MAKFKLVLISGISIMCLLQGCYQTTLVTPHSQPLPHQLTNTERTVLETALANLGQRVNLSNLHYPAGARKVSASYIGSWNMIGWMQFPSGQYQWASEKFRYGAYDFPALGYTDVYHSIRYYWKPDYTHSLTFDASGLFETQTNAGYNYSSYVSGGKFTHTGISIHVDAPAVKLTNTVTGGLDLYILYETADFMLIMSQYPNSSYWDYTIYTR